MPSYKLGELFCGPGGIGYGATTARISNTDYRIARQWATDYDRDTCDTYISNICPNAPESVVCQDIRELDFDTLSSINALAFGFPCNDFSAVGEQKGLNGKYGALYQFGVAALKKFQPDWFLAENVGGLRNSNDGKAFSRILDDMREAGYTITPCIIYLGF
jgi:DNA (cytosine-5)-methyltransferase 1